MWINSPSCHSARAAAGSTWESNSSLRMLASSAGLSGKPSPLSSWRRAWKRHKWLQRLSGRICDPSMASNGVEQWICLLRGIRVLRQGQWSWPVKDTSQSSPWLLEIRFSPTSDVGDQSPMSCAATALASAEFTLKACQGLSAQTNTLSLPGQDASAKMSGLHPQTCLAGIMSGRFFPMSSVMSEAMPSGGLSDDIWLTAICSLPISQTRRVGSSYPAENTSETQQSNESGMPDSMSTSARREPRQDCTFVTPDWRDGCLNSAGTLMTRCCPDFALNWGSSRLALCSQDISRETGAATSQGGVQPQPARHSLWVLLFLPNAHLASWHPSSSSSGLPPASLKAELSISVTPGGCESPTAIALHPLMVGTDGSWSAAMSPPAMPQSITSQLKRMSHTWQTGLLSTTASHSACRASAVDRMILAICGPTSAESLAKWNRLSSFLKTWPGTSPSGSTRSPMTSGKWATELRRASLLRRRSARRTSESGYSSLQWPTPNAAGGTGYMSGSNRDTWRPTLEGMAKGFRPVLHASREQRLANRQTPLWATPQAHDAKTGKSPQKVAEAKERSVGGTSNLNEMATMWPTPTVSGNNNAAGVSEKAGDGLAMAAKMWPTPAARDYKGANGAEHLKNGTGRLHLDQLPNFVSHCFPLDRIRSSSGEKSSDISMDLLRLNPRFVCWLMGWPMIAADGSVCSETEWSRYRRLMRSALCGALSALPKTS